MNIWELSLLAVGLSMDAFAVAICKGLSVQKATLKNCFLVGLYFGGAQALMPLLGYLLGTRFADLISNVDHWIAFALLGIIGGKMIWESRGKAEHLNNSFSCKIMLPLALATSIDALAVGVTFAFLQVNIVLAVCFIGITTFLLSALGLIIGNRFGNRFQSKAELGGGIILVLMGLKILLEHLGVIQL